MGKAATRAEGDAAGGFPFAAGKQVHLGGQNHLQWPLSGSKLSVDSARPRVGRFLLPGWSGPHARRDEKRLSAHRILKKCSSNTVQIHPAGAMRSARLEKIFAAIRRNKSTGEQRDTLRVIIREQLGALTRLQPGASR